MPTLFDPLKVGDLVLPNRVVMAPLTRLRGTVEHLPTELMPKYYAQRASAGLIVSEGIPIDPMGVGYPQVPGLWSEEQAQLWQPVTKAVHAAGGRIFAQIWHVGRISDPAYLKGKQPVGPSAIAAEGTVSHLRPKKEFETPRALEIEEVSEIVAAYMRGAIYAKVAGFDGVELHGANGYLLDQFLQSGSNHRTDEYGGSVENRARLMLEVTDAVAEVWGPGRVGMHLAPRGDVHGMSDANPAETFGYVARELGKRKIAFLMAREYEAPGWMGPRLKDEFGGVYIANERFTLATANEVVERGEADAVAEVFGPGRVGMHLAPRSDVHGMSDANPAETFGYVARELGKRKIAFLMAREYEAPGWMGPRLRDEFGGVYIANERFTFATANEVVERGEADAVAFGKLWISNPDLVERFRSESELNEPQAATFYTHGAEGYSDYPSLG